MSACVQRMSFLCEKGYGDINEMYSFSTSAIQINVILCLQILTIENFKVDWSSTAHAHETLINRWLLICHFASSLIKPPCPCSCILFLKFSCSQTAVYMNSMQKFSTVFSIFFLSYKLQNCFPIIFLLSCWKLLQRTDFSPSTSC